MEEGGDGEEMERKGRGERRGEEMGEYLETSGVGSNNRESEKEANEKSKDLLDLSPLPSPLQA